jgi:hypothetical protein
VVLPRVPREVFVGLRRATVEALAIVVSADRFLSHSIVPVILPARRRAAASSALVVLGGFSRSFNTRAESRTDRTICSARPEETDLRVV